MQTRIFEDIVKVEAKLFPPGMTGEELQMVLDTAGDLHVSHNEFCVGMGRLLLCDPIQQRVLSLVIQGQTRRQATQILDSTMDGFERVTAKVDDIESALKQRLAKHKASLNQRMDSLEKSIQEIKQLASG